MQAVVRIGLPAAHRVEVVVVVVVEVVRRQLPQIMRAAKLQVVIDRRIKRRRRSIAIVRGRRGHRLVMVRVPVAIQVTAVKPTVRGERDRLEGDRFD